MSEKESSQPGPFTEWVNNNHLDTSNSEFRDFYLNRLSKVIRNSNFFDFHPDDPEFQRQILVEELATRLDGIFMEELQRLTQDLDKGLLIAFSPSHTTTGEELT